MLKQLATALKIVLPKGRPNERGVGLTSTHNPSNANTVLTVPTYRDHQVDLFTDRSLLDSRALIKKLLRHDPDVSAAMNAYLTVADTPIHFKVKDAEGNLDREAHKTLNQILDGLTVRRDYSTGFSFTPTIRSMNENMRYLVLLRGAISAEMVMDKTLIPREIRQIDFAQIQWFERQPGLYKPIQRSPNSNQDINMDIATFFVAFFRRDPTGIYSDSPFVSSINTIAARQQVINDLYRIMQKTGYPRIEIKVVEEILRKNAPGEAQTNDEKMREWLSARLEDIRSVMGSLTPDQAFVHFDSVETNVMNKEGPGKAMDVTAIINVLNAQNQAALKTMATIIGRGEKGVNTASTEARVFSMNAEQINLPVAEIWSQMMTLAMRMQGYEGSVEAWFEKVELRPEMELEPQKAMKQTRHLELLSHGLITDDEFHMKMFNRLRPDSVKEFSGTGFLNPAPTDGIDVNKVSPNNDPLGRSLTAPGSKSARSNTQK